MNDNLNNQNIPAPSPDVAELNKRRALIKALYQEILGRDADINGLSYYTVNKQYSEDDIRKQMTQSTDHRDMVIKAQKYPEIEKKCIELEDQVIKLHNSNTEKDTLIANLRVLVSTSGNYSQTYTQEYKPEHSQDMMMSQSLNFPSPAAHTENPAYSVQNLTYPKQKGCLGLIRSFFGI
ncbi:MAG: DUF4214 domain-containing protein [bacterium]